MHLAHYLALLHRSQTELGDAFRTVAHSHAEEHDVHGAGRYGRRVARLFRGREEIPGAATQDPGHGRRRVRKLRRWHVMHG